MVRRIPSSWPGVRQWGGSCCSASAGVSTSRPRREKFRRPNKLGDSTAEPGGANAAPPRPQRVSRRFGSFEACTKAARKTPTSYLHMPPAWSGSSSGYGQSAAGAGRLTAGQWGGCEGEERSCVAWLAMQTLG